MLSKKPQFTVKNVATSICMSMSFGAVLSAHAADTFAGVNNQVTFSAGGQNLNYKESSAAVDPLDTEKGTLTAFRIGGVMQGALLGFSNIYLSGAVDYATGTTAYNGYLQNGLGALRPYQSRSNGQTTDVSIKLGRAFEIAQSGNMQLIPYIGYGYHAWDRDSSADPHGYEEKYNHHSVSAGLLGQYAITPKLIASADASVGRTFGGKMDASIVNGTFNLGSRPVVSGALGLDYALTPQVHVNASYRVTQFSYGQSNIVSDRSGSYYEPYSKTTQQTLLVGVGYAF